MPVAHKDLTGVHLHEPKGVAAAASGAVYIADGAGSGVWTPLDIPEGTFTIQESYFTASGTWTKPTDCFLVYVVAQGGGSGAGNSNGNPSTFGAHLTANSGGSGSAGSSGDINILMAGQNVATQDGDGTSGSARYVKQAITSIPFARNNGGISDTASTAGLIGNVSIKSFAASTLGATETVTIGAGGSGTGGPNLNGLSGMVYVKSYVLI